MINILAQFFLRPNKWLYFCFIWYFFFTNSTPNIYTCYLNLFFIHSNTSGTLSILSCWRHCLGALGPVSNWMGWLPTCLYSCYPWIPFPSFSHRFCVMLELLHPILCIFLFPCFSHSCWKTISTASCTEDDWCFEDMHVWIHSYSILKGTPVLGFCNTCNPSVLWCFFLWYKLSSILCVCFGFSYCLLKLHTLGYNNSYIVY